MPAEHPHETPNGERNGSSIWLKTVFGELRASGHLVVLFIAVLVGNALLYYAIDRNHQDLVTTLRSLVCVLAIAPDRREVIGMGTLLYMCGAEPPKLSPSVK
jgi:hypothetical protein